VINQDVLQLVFDTNLYIYTYILFHICNLNIQTILVAKLSSQILSSKTSLFREREKTFYSFRICFPQTNFFLKKKWDLLIRSVLAEVCRCQ
jgi:hypothetical protein